MRVQRLGDVLGRRYVQRARAGGRLELPEPLRESELQDLLCFFQERSEIAVEVDGVVAETPPTPWSGTGWLEAEWVDANAPERRDRALEMLGLERG